MADLILRIKERIGIEDVLEEFGCETKRKERPYHILCPFHEERHPSFYVNVYNDTAYCFGCQKGGDQITITALFLNSGIREAVSYWRKRLSLQDEDREDVREKREKAKRRLEEKRKKDAYEMFFSSLIKYPKENYEYLHVYYDYIYEVFDEIVKEKENLKAYDFLKLLLSWYFWAQRFLSKAKEEKYATIKKEINETMLR